MSNGTETKALAAAARAIVDFDPDEALGYTASWIKISEMYQTLREALAAFDATATAPVPAPTPAQDTELLAAFLVYLDQHDYTVCARNHDTDNGDGGHQYWDPLDRDGSLINDFLHSRKGK